MPRPQDLINYKCCLCDKGNRKLWRVAASSHIRLFCAMCISRMAREDLSGMQPDGTHISPINNDPTDVIMVILDDVSLDLVPALPLGDTFWTQHPIEDRRWWQGLPLGPMLVLAQYEKKG